MTANAMLSERPAEGLPTEMGSIVETGKETTPPPPPPQVEELETVFLQAAPQQTCSCENFHGALTGGNNKPSPAGFGLRRTVHPHPTPRRV